jgi:hypothetical protein
VSAPAATDPEYAGATRSITMLTMTHFLMDMDATKTRSTYI